MEADTLIADKAFDADARMLEPLAAAGKTAVIPPRTNRSSPRDYDQQLYGARHLIENFFAKIKQFRAIAIRYEKARGTSWLPFSCQIAWNPDPHFASNSDPLTVPG